MTPKDAREVVRMIVEVKPVPMEQWDGLWEFVRDKAIDPQTRLGILRPIVFTEWDLIVGRAFDAYEEILCELADDDPRIDEFYGEFGVNRKGEHCACERRWLESKLA